VPAHLLATVTVPLVTAFAADGTPDPARIDRLMVHLAGHGIDSVMLFGSNGEGTAVQDAEIRGYTRRIVERWKELAGDRATVLVTATAASTRQAVARATEALAGGADALVVSPPFYYRHTDAELLRHFSRVDAIGAPWVVYNIPRYTGNPISLELAAELAALPHCVGIKDSSGDGATVAGYATLSTAHPHFAASQGAEPALVAGLRTGAVGITPGLGNLAPGACRALFDAVAAGDISRADEIQHGLNRLAAIHTIRPGIAATKAALGVLGLVDTEPAEPFVPFDADETERLTAVLADVADVTGLG